MDEVLYQKFAEIIDLLNAGAVDYILIGGVAGVTLGAALVTYDIDIVYSREPANLVRLAKALASTRPRLRGAPEGLPFLWDDETLKRGLNFTLTTTLGDIDVLGEVAGDGTYTALLPHSSIETFSGRPVRCVSLTRLIHLKRSAGRAKDLVAIGELQALLKEREARGLPV